MLLSLLALVASRPVPVVEAEPYPFHEMPLVVAFAAAEDLDHVVAGARVPMAAAPELSAHDAYLVLPLRARSELLAAFASGVRGRIAQWFDAGVVVHAEVVPERWTRLQVRAAWKVRDLLEGGGKLVPASQSVDPVRDINRLPFIAGFAPCGLFDRHGAEAVTRRTVYVGSSRRGPDTDMVEPTFVWSERDAGGVRVKVALAASEDDSFHALLAPFTLV